MTGGFTTGRGVVPGLCLILPAAPASPVLSTINIRSERVTCRVLWAWEGELRSCGEEAVRLSGPCGQVTGTVTTAASEAGDTTELDTHYTTHRDKYTHDRARTRTHCLWTLPYPPVCYPRISTLSQNLCLTSLMLNCCVLVCHVYFVLHARICVATSSTVD